MPKTKKVKRSTIYFEMMFEKCHVYEDVTEDVSYAVTDEGLYCRTITHSFAPFRKGASETGKRFDPEEGVIPTSINSWQDVELTD